MDLLHSQCRNPNFLFLNCAFLVSQSSKRHRLVGSADAFTVISSDLGLGAAADHGEMGITCKRHIVGKGGNPGLSGNTGKRGNTADQRGNTGLRATPARRAHRPQGQHRQKRASPA